MPAALFPGVVFHGTFAPGTSEEGDSMGSFLGAQSRLGAEPEIRSSEDFMAACDRQAAEAKQERARAEELWRTLQASGDPKAWRTLVLEDPAYRSWGLCEKLCLESAAVAEDDAVRAGELVAIALELAPQTTLPENRKAALLEYIWKHVGNVCRARGDLKRAEEAFARAQEHFLGGMRGILPSVLERGRLSALEAALLRDRGDVAGALEKIDFALRLADDSGSSRSALLLEEGRLRRRLGQSELALAALSRASRSAAGTSDPRLLLRIQIELGSVLCDLGRPSEVRKLPAPLRKAAQDFPVEQTRLLCLEGRIAAGLGHLPEAEAVFQRLFSELRDRAVADLALLLLEIAALSLRQGRTADLGGLTEAALRLTESPLLGREAAATLKLFSRLAAQEKLTAERAAQFAKDFSKISCAQTSLPRVS
jgi:tetratricopeptide (TPR) repeat protein